MTLSASPLGRAVVEGLWLRYQGTPVEEDVAREQRRRVLQTLVWFLLTLLLALFIPDIGKVISVIGGLAACFIFVFPGAAPSSAFRASGPQLLSCSPGGEGNHQHVLITHLRLCSAPVQPSSEKKMHLLPPFY